MSNKSKIEWTESTWNPVTGCTKISEGCENCYAYTMAKRLKAMKNIRYSNGFNVTLHEDLIERPYEWKKPRLVFVNSMSDLFHEYIPLDFIQKLFKVMNDTPMHTYQILTKRSKRLSEIFHQLKWTKNIWIGVSVENNSTLERITDLEVVPARIKFVSFEPLIEGINELKLNNINWVIVGGESGPKARPIQAEWVKDIRDYCVKNRIPFFFKQWGGTRKHKTGRLLDERTWDELPDCNI